VLQLSSLVSQTFFFNSTGFKKMQSHSEPSALMPLSRRQALTRCFAAVIAGLFCYAHSAWAVNPQMPNILWISSEDHGQEMGCYGDTYADTPNVDALASQGLLYRHVWSTAPVCAPARTTIISGIYPTSLGAEHMRSFASLPPGVKMFPELMRQAGYYCTNNSKEDYNLPTSRNVWDQSSRMAHYKNREPDQPFFAVFNSTVSHESSIRGFKGEPKHDPAAAPVPAYHPDTPVVRRDWAIYYDTVTAADAIAGQHLRELEDAGLAESTIVFYWGDHGSGMPRGKRWPSDSGLRVPLVVFIPEAFAHLRPTDYVPGGRTDRLVGFVDFAPTMLSLIGIEPPEWMQGHAFLGKFVADSPSYLYGFRGRMDERADLVRSVTDGRFVYIKNYMPHLSQGQHVAYQMETATTRQWRDLYERGDLNEAQSRFWTVPKDPEEFYDLQDDPNEVVNLAGSAEHRDVLQQFRDAHRDHVFEIRDVGFIPEGDRYQLTRRITPYEFGHDDDLYPLKKIFDAAQLASAIDDQSDQTIAALAQLTDHEDRTLRYWGAMGLLMRGAGAVHASADDLAKLLEDDASAVRLAAARALAQYGEPAVTEDAVELLLAHANWSKHDVFTVMDAITALETLDQPLRSRAGEIAKLPTQGNAPHGRYSSYVPRLLERLNALSSLPE
jgi:arylsulfatase A-like enzyme